MHTIKAAIRALALLGFLSGVSACKDEPPTVESATTARTKFCKDGGAEFNAETNECVCPYAAHWTGARCEAKGDAPPAQPEAPAPAIAAVAPMEPAEVQEPQAETPPPAVEPAAPAPAVDEALKTACRKAKAHWVADGGYCLCPRGQDLVGRSCRDVGGRVTDDMCQRAVHRGKWKKGDCACGPDQVFVPARGGCVARLAATDTPNVVLLRRVCESSLNHGKWDAATARCACPPGRIWHDEICQAQYKLTSRVVCESAFNQGTWNRADKSCACKPGFFWINQRCISAKTLNEKTACEAESSKATWNAAVSRCVCPGLTKWDSKTLACVK